MEIICEYLTISLATGINGQQLESQGNMRYWRRYMGTYEFHKLRTGSTPTWALIILTIKFDHIYQWSML